MVQVVTVVIFYMVPICVISIRLEGIDFVGQCRVFILKIKPFPSFMAIIVQGPHIERLLTLMVVPQ